MPKGQKLKQAPPPPLAHCDFCGQGFTPPRWNCRTCVTCAAEGMPDQSIGDWKAYTRTVATIFRAIGRKKPLTGAAAWRASPLAGQS